MSPNKLGRYDLVRVLGKGAMGIVYEGRDPNLDRRVAIKTVRVENLSEEAAADYESRFRTEARSAARLQHPNIVSVYDSDRDGDVAFLVMEFIQGEDLKRHLDRGSRYTLAQSLTMVRDLLSALDYAHRQGIVHRDIKPANLLIEASGRVKLADFGVARVQDSGEVTRTQGGMVGSLKYMAPEQVQGLPVDSRADLFSVGIVLYQLLTDRKPFDGDNDFSIIHQIIGHQPSAPSQLNASVPTAIDAVVARALAKRPDDRFGSARDFAVALQSAMRRVGDTSALPPSGPLPLSATAFPASASEGTTSPSVTQEIELVYWKDVKDSVEEGEVREFLAKFPEGIYADLAKRRLRRLMTGSTADGSDVISAGMLLGERDAAPPPKTARPITETMPLSAMAAELPASATGDEFAPTQQIDLSVEELAALPRVGSDEPLLESARPRKSRSRDRRRGGSTKPAVGGNPVSRRAGPRPALVIASLALLTLVGYAGLVALKSRDRGVAPVVAAVAPTGVAQAAQTPPVIATATANPASASGAGETSARASPAETTGSGTATSIPVDVSTTSVAGAAAASVRLAQTSSALVQEGSRAKTLPNPSIVAAAAVSAASAKRPGASAAKPTRRASEPTPEPTSVAAQTAPPPPRPESRAEAKTDYSPVSSPRVAIPSDACNDTSFIARQLCLARECDSAQNHAAPSCVKYRADARLREESAIRN